MLVKGRGKVIKLHVHSKADIAFPKLLSLGLCNLMDSLCATETVNKL